MVTSHVKMCLNKKKNINRKNHYVNRSLGFFILGLLFIAYSSCPLTAQNTPSVFPSYYRVISARLNVRKLPSAESAIIGSLSKDDTVCVKSMKKSWGEIDFKKGIGYVSAKFIEPIQKESVEESPIQPSVNDNNKQKQTVENTTAKSHDNKRSASSLNQLDFRLSSSLLIGLSNLYSFDAYSHPRFGFGFEIESQVTASTLPRHMFSEVAIGFMSLGNSNYSFPSLSINILPIGYRSDSFGLWKYHDLKYYAIGGISMQIPFGEGIYFYRNSLTYSFSPVFNLNIYIKGGLELTKSIAVGFMYMHGLTNVCRNLPIGIKNSAFQLYGTIMFDNWNKEK